MAGDFIIGDWGTTRLRAWRVSGGVAGRRRDFPLGVAALGPGEAAARFESDVRPALDGRGLPVLLCGMVGSTLGWTLAPYMDCPASLEGLAGALVKAAPGVRIVPGLKCHGLTGPEVLRGEETQALGWLAGDPARRLGRRILCHPGTHAKWIEIEAGRVQRFTTAMTGELFAVLARHSVLRTETAVEDEAAFDAGVAAAGGGEGLSTRLFGVRARVLTGDLPEAASASYLSGLLIGAEVAFLTRALGPLPGGAIDLVGEPGLCRWYARALHSVGLEVVVSDGEPAAVAGLLDLWNAA